MLPQGLQKMRELRLAAEIARQREGIPAPVKSRDYEERDRIVHAFVDLINKKRGVSAPEPQNKEQVEQVRLTPVDEERKRNARGIAELINERRMRK